MTDPDATLAERLGELVRGVPGVDRLYTSHSVVVAVTDAAVGTLVGDRGPRHPISVERTGDGITVSAVIGIGAKVSATKLCRVVFDVIAAQLTAEAVPIAAIEVRVGSIG